MAVAVKGDAPETTDYLQGAIIESSKRKTEEHKALVAEGFVKESQKRGINLAALILFDYLTSVGAVISDEEKKLGKNLGSQNIANLTEDSRKQMVKLVEKRLEELGKISQKTEVIESEITELNYIISTLNA